MNLQSRINAYLEQPIPLWDTELTRSMVENKCKEMFTSTSQSCNKYTLAGCIIKDRLVEEIAWPLYENDKTIRIVLPSDALSSFYENHGLEPIVLNNISATEIAKVKSALAVFSQVQPVSSFVNKIIKSIQLIKAENPETDISYSHPDIPFSIFFSICEDVSMISDLRVAESILHEAMHLKLTLIESIVPLINLDSKDVYYSPWRDEKRSARGVLHGLYVFRSIFDFYEILETRLTDDSLLKYLSDRKVEIIKEINQLKEFPNSPGLSKNGQRLASKLLL